MFTGIVEEAAEVVGFEATGAGKTLTVKASFVPEVCIGESIAVNGCCLTAVRIDSGAGCVSFDLLDQTLRVTNLGALKRGGLVNLERALRAGDRFSGHFVQGHVDDTAEILAFERVGDDYRLEVALAEQFRALVISRGSVALDGISLTVAELEARSFSCFIIPHTREITNLAQCTPGGHLNVEFDMIGKYIVQNQRFMEIRDWNEKKNKKK